VTGFLLDANVLIAMAWPAHTDHARAQRWFGKNAHHGWATCPLTELAFVRIISNPAFSPDALTPPEALSLLSANLKHPSHRFWPDAVPLLGSIKQAQPNILGHQQLTDAYLLGLAAHNGARLATLDKRLGLLLKDPSNKVELIQ
jgi:toxin-antitoxin system PIN domain toxin